MIEILLALTIIAIGMTSILGLFPVGLNASRNAIAQNMSSDVADQMITYMQVMGESSQTAYGYTFTDSGTDLPLSTELAVSTSGEDTTINLNETPSVNVETLSDNFLTAYKTDKVGFGNSTVVGTYAFQRVAPDWSVFTIDHSSAPNLRRRVYFVVQGPNCTKDAGNRNIDFSAMVLVWKSQVQIRKVEPDGTTWNTWTPAYSISGKINIELSWPLEQPYKDRKKRYYQVVITKPSS